MDSTEFLWFDKCGMVANCGTYLQSTQIQHHCFLFIYLFFLKLEVTHVEIIKKKYPSLIALAKLIKTTELLWFGKCGIVAN